jgi:hypothetical protein
MTTTSCPTSRAPNQFYVFGLQDSDLPNFVAQSIAVPEPATWAMMLTGSLGLGGMLRARRRTGVQP